MQETDPLVSVLITAYNREKYIADAIQSILASSYQNFEIIIVDDCSYDNTVSVAREFEKIDSRIKVFINDINLGDYDNRNKAASFAKGKYIKFLDSDDLILPNGLEKFVRAMEENSNAAFGLSLEQTLDVNFPKILMPKDIFLGYFGGKGTLNCGPSGSIIRSCKFKEVKGFSGKRYISDTELWLKLSQTNSMLILEPKLIIWREHEDQEFRLGNNSNDYILLRNRLNNFYIKNSKSPLSLPQRLRFLLNQHKILISNMFRVTKTSKRDGYSLFKAITFK